MSREDEASNQFFIILSLQQREGEDMRDIEMCIIMAIIEWISVVVSGGRRLAPPCVRLMCVKRTGYDTAMQIKG